MTRGVSNGGPLSHEDEKSKRWTSLDSEIVASLEEWKRTQGIELENRKRRLDREAADEIGELLEEHGPALGMPFSRHLDDGIFELRTVQGRDITRVLYSFVAGGEIVLIHGFVK